MFKRKQLTSGVALAFILVVAAVMRFYRLHKLQYYSFDDELATMFMYNLVVKHKLLLAGTTATLDIPLSAWWYYLSWPLFWLSKFDPLKILTFGSVLGVGVTYLVYRLGTELANKRVGLWASLFYAGSFMTALLDRRWWALSFDPLLIIVAIFSLYKMAKGKLIFVLPLTFVAAFGWQMDPTLGIIGVAALLSLMAFKVRLKTKIYLMVLGLVMMSILPLVVLELRHKRAVTTPYTKLFNRSAQVTQVADQEKNELNLDALALGFTRAFWARPTDAAENYLFPGSSAEHLNFNWVVKLITILIIIMPIYLIFSGKSQQTVGLKILYMFLAAFLISVFVVNRFAKVHISQHYYAVIWPVVFLLTAFTLEWWWRKKQRWLTLAYLSLFLFFNFRALVYSQMRYPLDEKIKLVKLVADRLDSKPFSFDIVSDIHLYGGGLGGVLAKHNLFPSNQTYYGFDWAYRAFSLYQVPVVGEDKLDQKVVIYPEWVQPDWDKYGEVIKVQAYQVGRMKAVILRTGGRGND